MENFVDGPEMPMGLGMALAQNEKAMEYFASLSPQRRKAIIEQTHQIHSKQEMKQFVDELCHE